MILSFLIIALFLISTVTFVRTGQQKFIPLALIITLIGLYYSLGLNEYITFTTLKSYRRELLEFVQAYPLLGPTLFMALYTTVIALSVPGGALMTITAGFLFGQIFGTLYVVVAATLGAILIFLITKTALHDLMQSKAAPWFKKMKKGFQDNAFHYLLVIRLIPIFPFFVVNIVPALLGMKLKEYSLATFVGIIPGSFVYASIGVGLGSVFDRGETFSLQGILTPEIIFALCGLALLSILPLLYKKFKKKS